MKPLYGILPLIRDDLHPTEVHLMDSQPWKDGYWAIRRNIRPLRIVDAEVRSG